MNVWKRACQREADVRIRKREKLDHKKKNVRKSPRRLHTAESAIQRPDGRRCVCMTGPTPWQARVEEHARKREPYDEE